MLEIFPITPASAKPLWFIGVVSLILVAVLVLMAWLAYSSRRSRVELSDDQIRLAGDLWGRTIPLTQLRVAEARVVNLDEHTDLQPKRRTMGTGMPGYSSGWFRLRNGDKALIYLTRRDHVVYVPTTEGYSLLLSVDEPGRFLEALAGK